MNEQETARTLDALLYMDRMTVRLYDEAIAKLDEQTTATLTKFRDDHQRHEQRLGRLAGGRKPEDPSDDVKSLVEEHARVMRAAQGRDAIMEALLIAERTNAAMYDAADNLQTSGDISQTLSQHHADEHTHVEFVEQHVPVLAAVISGAGESGQHEISCMTGGLTDDRNPDDFE